MPYQEPERSNIIHTEQVNWTASVNPQTKFVDNFVGFLARRLGRQAYEIRDFFYSLGHSGRGFENYSVVSWNFPQPIAEEARGVQIVMPFGDIVSQIISMLEDGKESIDPFMQPQFESEYSRFLPILSETLQNEEMKNTPVSITFDKRSGYAQITSFIVQEGGHP